MKVVVAEWNVGWQRAGDIERGAIFENEAGRCWNLHPLTGASYEHRCRARRIALGAHRLTQRLTRRPRQRAPFAERVVIAVGDAPRICHPGHSTRRGGCPRRYARFRARGGRRRLDACRIAARSAPGDWRSGAHRSPTRRTRAGTVVSVKSRGSTPAWTSRHVSGVDTPAKSEPRALYAVASVLPRKFCM